jgi:hypothetical protein
MKKFLFTAILMVAIGACGVQQPYPLSIELINATGSGVPYAQQGYQAVRANYMTDVKVSWDVTDTGAHGVQLVAAADTDYYCENPIATATLYITNSQTLESTNYMNNLAQIFCKDLSKFVAGRYALCLKSVMYDSVSAPSLPVFMELLFDQQAGMCTGYYL